MADCIRGWRQKLIDCRFQDLVFEDAMDLLLEQVQREKAKTENASCYTLISFFLEGDGYWQGDGPYDP